MKHVPRSALSALLAQQGAVRPVLRTLRKQVGCAIATTTSTRVGQVVLLVMLYVMAALELGVHRVRPVLQASIW